jgi:hypothetical protein
VQLCRAAAEPARPPSRFVSGGEDRGGEYFGKANAGPPKLGQPEREWRMPGGRRGCREKATARLDPAAGKRQEALAVRSRDGRVRSDVGG